MIRAISFDLDDTLWPVAPAIAQAELDVHAFFARHAPAIAERFPPEVQRERRVTLWKSRPDLKHNLTAIRRLAVEELFTGAGLNPDTALVDGAMEAYFAARNAVQFYDDVSAVLPALGQRYTLATLTNGNANLQRIGIAHWFAHDFSSSRFGVAKPDPAIFAAACEQLALPPAQVLHVGDDAALDVRAARAAGLQVFWLNREDRAWDSDEPAPPSGSTLHELVQWLGQRIGQ